MRLIGLPVFPVSMIAHCAIIHERFVCGAMIVEISRLHSQSPALGVLSEIAWLQQLFCHPKCGVAIERPSRRHDRDRAADRARGNFCGDLSVGDHSEHRRSVI
jgi:hypothetical protein